MYDRFVNTNIASIIQNSLKGRRTLAFLLRRICRTALVFSTQNPPLRGKGGRIVF